MRNTLSEHDSMACAKSLSTVRWKPMSAGKPAASFVELSAAACRSAVYPSNVEDNGAIERPASLDIAGRMSVLWQRSDASSGVHFSGRLKFKLEVRLHKIQNYLQVAVTGLFRSDIDSSLLF